MATRKDYGMIPRPPAESPPAPGVPGADGPAAGAVNPLALTVAQAAKVLSAAGVGAVTEEMIRRHIDAGAPATADGRINLVHYAAWLNQRMNREDHGA